MRKDPGLSGGALNPMASQEEFSYKKKPEGMLRHTGEAHTREEAM